MTDYHIVLVNVDDRDLVVEALRGAADQRQRVATKAAAEVLDEKRANGKDPRTASVRIVTMLAEAANLTVYADGLEAANITPARQEPGMVPPPTDTPEQGAQALDPTAAAERAVVVHVGADGLSEAAHRLADLAGLEDTELGEEPDLDLDEDDGDHRDRRLATELEDPETNELPEDLAAVDGDGHPEPLIIDLDTPAPDEADQ